MLEGGDLRDGEAVTAAVRNTTIEGVGGTAVALDSNGDRVDTYEVMNYVVGADDVMSSVAVGMFDATLKEYKAYEQAVVWPGGTMDIPVDYLSGAFHATHCCSVPALWGWLLHAAFIQWDCQIAFCHVGYGCKRNLRFCLPIKCSGDLNTMVNAWPTHLP